MKDVFKLSNVLFYLLSAIVFFFLGMMFAGIAGAGKGQGLASGGIVFGYGVIAGFLAFIISIFAAQFLKRTQVILLNKILVVIFILSVGFLMIRSQNRHAFLDESAKQASGRVLYAAVAVPAMQANEDDQNLPPMGLGMTAPNFYENEVIYFYGNPNLEKAVSEHAPFDSLVFKRTELGFELTYAPPWFVPAHLKLDYDMLFMRVLSVNSEFIEVVVNETNGQTSFMDRLKNNLKYWPDFLLTINSVELLNPQDNPVRIKPLSYASLVLTEYSFLRPFRIADQWVQVELLDDNFNPLGKGWVKWRENGKLLIKYSLLS